MTHRTRTTVAGACMVAVLATAQSASAAGWQRTYLEPAIHAWMGVVTFLADDGEREDDDQDSPCEGKCEKGECKKCDRKKGGPGGPEWMGPPHFRGGPHGSKPPHHGHGPHHMGPHHGPRGDALSLLHDISARLARIERMLAARGPGGPPPHAHPHRMRHGEHEGMEGPRHEMHERMRAAREKWENASPEEREEMKAKWEAKMKEGREKMAAAREKWENASPEERAEMKKKWEARMNEARERMNPRPDGGPASPRSEAHRPMMDEARGMVEAARKRAAELENRVKRLEAELERVKRALQAEGS